MEDYSRYLFPYLDESRLKLLSCDHVVPEDHVLARPICKGSTGVKLDFTFEKRNDERIINELGECLLQLCATVPDGFVVFFPSYDYMDRVTREWRKPRGNALDIWSQLNRLKPAFCESKGAGNAEDILKQYTTAVTSPSTAGTGHGALLLAVIGGKMSEGINFSDRLGRAVAVVGLPFPNAQSAEWKARLAHIEQRTRSSGGSPTEGKAAARSVYENACMRAVNQSIGRAIRHAQDYASIVLLDHRYSTPRIQGKLPGWIRKSLVTSPEASTDDAIRDIRSFFASKPK